MDWVDGPVRYGELHKLFQLHREKRVYVSTAVPKSQIDYVKENIGTVDRVPISEMNRKLFATQWPELLGGPDGRLNLDRAVGSLREGGDG